MLFTGKLFCVAMDSRCPFKRGCFIDIAVAWPATKDTIAIVSCIVHSITIWSSDWFNLKFDNIVRTHLSKRHNSLVAPLILYTCTRCFIQSSCADINNIKLSSSSGLIDS